MKKFLKTMGLTLLTLSQLLAPSTALAQDKVLNLSTGAEPPTIDPGLSSDTTSGVIIDNVFENLTEMNNEGEVVPGAAESWEVSEDGLVYTFKLRAEAKWSNGDPVTAADFEYAWERMLDPEKVAQRANLFFDIKGAEAYSLGEGSLEDVGIKAVDDLTFEVTLAHPVAYFPELINHYVFAPVNQKVVEGNPDWAMEAGEDYVTNGPFVLSSWNHNSDYTLSKNDQYWDKDQVKLDQVNVQIVESESTASTMYQSGDLDYLGSPFGTISLENLPVFQESGELQKIPYSAIYWYKCNISDPVMSNVNIRKALALAIDRQGLIENVMHGAHIPATGLVPPTIPSFEEERGYFKDADLEQAKAYLAKGLEELGMKDPAELTINLSINTSEAHATIAQYVQENWARNLGINTQIDNSEWQVYLDKVQSLDYQVARMGWAADYNDASSFLGMYRTSQTGNNDTGWENPDFKAKLDEANSEADGDKRNQLLHEAEAIIMEEMPVIPIYYNENNYVLKDTVKGMRPDPIGRIHLKYVSIE